MYMYFRYKHHNIIIIYLVQFIMIPFFSIKSYCCLLWQRTGKGREVIVLGEFQHAICLDEDANIQKHLGPLHSRQKLCSYLFSLIKKHFLFSLFSNKISLNRNIFSNKWSYSVLIKRYICLVHMHIDKNDFP